MSDVQKRDRSVGINEETTLALCVLAFLAAFTFTCHDMRVHQQKMLQGGQCLRGDAYKPCSEASQEGPTR